MNEAISGGFSTAKAGPPASARKRSARLRVRKLHLHHIGAAHRERGGGFFRPRGAFGANPPHGAIIDFYLKSAVEPPKTAPQEGADKVMETETAEA